MMDAKCEFFFRRRKRCQKNARIAVDLGMALCREHEDNERMLRAIGYDSRDDERARVSSP